MAIAVVALWAFFIHFLQTSVPSQTSRRFDVEVLDIQLSDWQVNDACIALTQNVARHLLFLPKPNATTLTPIPHTSKHVRAHACSAALASRQTPSRVAQSHLRIRRHPTSTHLRRGQRLPQPRPSHLAARHPALSTYRSHPDLQANPRRGRAAPLRLQRFRHPLATPSHQQRPASRRTRGQKIETHNVKLCELSSPGQQSFSPLSPDRAAYRRLCEPAPEACAAGLGTSTMAVPWRRVPSAESQDPDYYIHCQTVQRARCA